MLNQYDCVRDYNFVKPRKRLSNINTAVVTMIEESAFEVKGCNHIFHLGCAKQIVQNQTSGTFFECPVCKTIQGIKTGNQPESGEMKISKEDFDLPGYKKGWTLKKNDDTMAHFVKVWTNKVNEMERSSVKNDVCGKIRSTIGKAILLTNKKGRFEQFRTLIENCEFGLGEKATTCMDLQVSI